MQGRTSGKEHTCMDSRYRERRKQPAQILRVLPGKPVVRAVEEILRRFSHAFFRVHYTHSYKGSSRFSHERYKEIVASDSSFVECCALHGSLQDRQGVLTRRHATYLPTNRVMNRYNAVFRAVLRASDDTIPEHPSFASLILLDPTRLFHWQHPLRLVTLHCPTRISMSALTANTTIDLYVAVRTWFLVAVKENQLT